MKVRPKPAADAPRREWADWLTESSKAAAQLRAVGATELAEQVVEAAQSALKEAGHNIVFPRTNVVNGPPAPIAIAPGERMCEAAWSSWYVDVASYAVGFQESTMQEIIDDAKAMMREAEVATPAERAITSQRQREAETAFTEEQARVVQMRPDHDRKVDALVALLEGKRGGYGSLQEAYADITGAAPLAMSNAAQWARGLGGYEWTRHTESVQLSTWGKVFGDSVTRRVVDEYATTPGLNAWRSVVSSIRTNADYRTQRVTRIGGYGILPTVAEGAPFNPLPTPANEEATYAVAKKGGTEDYTFEAYLSGDISPLQRAIERLGRAAASTLNRAVFDLFSANAATTYDSVAWFHATHTNLTSTPLSATAVAVTRLAMRKQASLSDPSDILGVIPRYLLVAPELEEIALQICAGYREWPAEDPLLRTPMDVIVVPHWTSPSMWHVVADTRSVPTIEVGFTGDSPDPSIDVQAGATAGSMFNADKVTFKLRHPWGMTALDHRGVARGNA